MKANCNPVSMNLYFRPGTSALARPIILDFLMIFVLRKLRKKECYSWMESKEKETENRHIGIPADRDTGRQGGLELIRFSGKELYGYYVILKP